MKPALNQKLVVGRYEVKLTADNSNKIEIVNVYVDEPKTVDQVHEDILKVFKTYTNLIDLKRIRSFNV